VSPFLSSFYAFFSGVFEFFVDEIEWIGDFVLMAYIWIVTAFEDIKRIFRCVLQFFEYLPDIIEVDFSSFFVHKINY
jgi:hypothetical protein